MAPAPPGTRHGTGVCGCDVGTGTGAEEREAGKLISRLAASVHGTAGEQLHKNGRWTEELADGLLFSHVRFGPLAEAGPAPSEH